MRFPCTLRRSLISLVLGTVLYLFFLGWFSNSPDAKFGPFRNKNPFRTWKRDLNETHSPRTAEPWVLNGSFLEGSTAPTPEDSLEVKMYPNFKECSNRPLFPFYQRRGDYWVIENYIPARVSFQCHESVTYTTHSEYSYLDNLGPLTARWKGPISIAVYTPGTDFTKAVSTILYLRDCWKDDIKKYVTFHLFFPVKYAPAEVPSPKEILERKTNCSEEPPKWSGSTSYRKAKKLLYPINVARNTARMASQTFFVLPSDIELYPSVNFIPEFFKMLRRPDISNTTKPHVFVFSVFEVKWNVTAPETKTQLVKLLKKGDAIPFHKYICPQCHNVPKAKEWLKAPIKPGLSVFHVGKRHSPHSKWEPIYLGTNEEPLYDERLSWEGQSDKMTQMYILCVKDYEFHILDNAFLVHRPGIKGPRKTRERNAIIGQQYRLVRRKILREYKKQYGRSKKCLM